MGEGCMLRSRKEPSCGAGRKPLRSCCSPSKNSREDIVTVVQVLQEFAKATGQHLHPAKSVVLPIGQKCNEWSEIIGQRYQGLQVRDEARALGITFHAWAEDVTADFERHKDNIGRAYDKISRLNLSAIGRGILAPVYGTSRFLYAAEFAAVPQQIIKELTKWTKKLVDKGLPPNKVNGKFQGINVEASAAYPSQGGFGNLDWQNHIKARQMKWAHRLLVDTDTTPWIWIMRLYVQLVNIPVMRVVMDKSTSTWWEEAQTKLAKPARRLLNGLCSLPTPRWNGPEGTNIPTNIFLPALPIWGSTPWWDNSEKVSETCAELLGKSKIQAIGQIINAWWRLRQITNQLQYNRWLRWHGIHSQTTRAELLHYLQELWNVLPGQVQQQAMQQLLNPPIQSWEGMWDTVATVMTYVRWDKTNANVDGAMLTVKEATLLIRDDSYKIARWERYMTLAGDTSHGNTSQITITMSRLFKRLWQCELLNRFKEPFWRLVYDAIPTPARIRMTHLPCVCGHLGVDRSHVFWDCVVFQVMIQSIQHQITTEINKQMVWMVQPPTGMYEKVWEIIALTMIYTRDKIRRWSVSDRIMNIQEVDLDLWKRRTVAIFKKYLVEFVIRRDVVPNSWVESKLEANPIIYINREELEEDPTLTNERGGHRRKLRISI